MRTRFTFLLIFFIFTGAAISRPVQIRSFSGTVINGNDVRLDWMTVSEVNNYGFYVQRKTGDDVNFATLPNSFVPGQGTTLEQHYYSWIDINLPLGIYQYRLKQVDLDGLEHFTLPIEIVISYIDSLHLSISSPLGNEEWSVGSSHAITWMAGSAIAQVNLDYSSDNGTNWHDIVTGINASNQSYGWIVPLIQTPNQQMKIKLTSASDAAITCTSISFSVVSDSSQNKDTSNIQVQNRWNLVSLPLRVSYSIKTAVFPTATSIAWRYDDVYEASDTLEKGIGYWLKFNTPQNLSIVGVLDSVDTMEVSSGWNLIGSISKPVAVSSISSESINIVASNFFGYNDSYFSTDTIFPGKGYWVKVNQSGQLIFASFSQIAPKNRINIIPTSELPPSPPDHMTSQHAEIPREFALDNAFPSPFNPSTIIRYQLPVDSRVSLTVYNILGQAVSILLNDQQAAGYKSIEWNASGYAGGVYFYRIVAGDFVQTKKMVLMR